MAVDQSRSNPAARSIDHLCIGRNLDIFTDSQNFSILDQDSAVFKSFTVTVTTFPFLIAIIFVRSFPYRVFL